MDQVVDTWSFVVRVTSIGIDVQFELNNSELLRHESLRFEGNVVAGQDLIGGTTVYATIWAGDDQGRAQRMKKVFSVAPRCQRMWRPFAPFLTKSLFRLRVSTSTSRYCNPNFVNSRRAWL
jgi:hypothetical protein